MNWYAVQVASNRVASFIKTLNERLQDNDDDEMKEKFGDIFCPAEDVIERKQGKKRVTSRVYFPNYIFIEMEMDPKTWHLINRLPMTKGFVGDSNTNQAGNDEWQPPQPVNRDEIEKIKLRVNEGQDKPKPKVMFEIGESVRIKEGAFTNFTGNVNDINYETSRITVSVNVFNRPTEIQIDFEHVEKM